MLHRFRDRGGRVDYAAHVDSLHFLKLGLIVLLEVGAVENRRIIHQYIYWPEFDTYRRNHISYLIGVRDVALANHRHTPGFADL